MKNIILFLALWMIISPVMAQKNIDKHINFTGKESLILNIQIADSIAIHTWNKEEVFTKATVNINDNKDNEAYLTSFDETGKTVKIKAYFEDDYFKGNKNCCMESNICWEIYIPENTVFSVETINGNITIDGITTDIKAKTISGFIDWKVLPNRKADLELKTISGTLYSDLEIAPDNKSNSFPQVISQKLNNGGYMVNLETISGDIFCRKSK
jgi:hypothetical protein